MDDFVSERIGNNKSASVDNGAGWSGDDGWNVASVAADTIEDRSAGLRVGGIFEIRIASGSFRSSHEAGETVDVRIAVRVLMILGVCGAFAKRGQVFGLQTAGHAYFVEVSIGGKRQQTCVLIFPA